MNNKLQRILSTFRTPEKTCIIGNEAIARGAIEAGVKGVFSYPGTPSTEISEVFMQVSIFQHDSKNQETYPELTSEQIYFEYSINEKVALEKAIAYSIGNRRAMCVMKNAGMNVASDPLITIAYQTTGKAVVIVICDDPGCFSSSNEQDSRYWGKMASVPVFIPSTPVDAYSMTKDAFLLSEQISLPVIVRMTTRVDHSRGIVYFGQISEDIQLPGFSKNPQHLNIPAKTAVAHKNLLTKLESEPVIQVQKKSNCLYFNGSAAKTITKDVNFGIIAGGVSTSYALEILLTNLLSGKVAILKVGMTHPFPNNDVLEFLKHGFDKILILEESDPIIENEVRILAQKNQLTTKILGKEFGGLSRVGEYSLDIIRIAIREFVEMSLREKKILPSKDIDRFLNVLPPRPPALCPGCSHRATYYALKLALQKDRNKLFLCGDIGCFALGAFPPFQLIDSIHHMGMSVSMAQGLSEAIQFGNGEKQKIVALVGDGTFFHSSVASLMNAVYTKANITVIIFDNRNIGMTGHQPNPGAVQQDSNREVDLPKLLKGIGVEFVDTVDPNNVIECFESINNAVSYKGVSVVVTQSPCVFLPEFKVKTLERIKKVTVDPNLCNTCHNQEDNEIFCSKEFSPDIALVKARAKLIARDHIQAKEQACPANICNHEFFNSLLNGDYKSALNVVRDKMLFARICGDLCHKPCEFMFRTEDQKVVPIRELKHFVAGFETNFEDFSIQEKRVKTAPKREQSIAIVGSGPAGLSAAYDLIQLGYDVTVFERESYAGGLLKSAIPAFRMDKKGLEKEVSILQNLGVKFRFNTSLGRDTKLEDISSTFEGVILAIGMGAHTTMDVIEENIAPEQNFDAVGFLEKYNLNQLNLKKQATLFVIGGGNSALDAARAAKEYGIDRVTIVYRRSREEMPAFNEEIEEAINEGVEILHHRVIDSCFTDDSGKINLSLKSFGNGEPKGSLRGDYIVSAIGQKGNVEDFSELLKSDWSGRVTADSSSGKTDYKNVFVAGDICAENHVSIIGAIASGKRAATGIRQLIEGYKYDYEGNATLKALNSPEMSRQKSTRTVVPLVDALFINSEMTGFDLYQVCGKCDHCIDNFGCPALIKVNGKVVIDELQCNNCGQCVDVCINNAIHWT